MAVSAVLHADNYGRGEDRRPESIRRDLIGVDLASQFNTAIWTDSAIMNNDYPAIAATLSRPGMARFPLADSGTTVTSTMEAAPLPFARTKSWREWKGRSVARWPTL